MVTKEPVAQYEVSDSEENKDREIGSQAKRKERETGKGGKLKGKKEIKRWRNLKRREQ